MNQVKVNEDSKSFASAPQRIESHEMGRANDFITVVLPCLNEEDSVGLVVQEALVALDATGIPGEVLVIDNGSLDRSAEVASEAGARVINEPRRGYGRALRTGIKEARGTIIVMADADWTYDMKQIPRLLEPVLGGEADIAIGSRLDSADRLTMPLLHKYLGTPVLTALIRRAGNYRDLRDSQSGFRCFRKDSIEALSLRSDGMEFASEMLIKGSLRSLRVVDVPTGYRKRIGTSKLNTLDDGWRHLRLIILLAPELILVVPGGTLFVLGVILSAAAFLPSRGISVGSLRWQPIFFATIALMLGLQMMLVGLVFVWRRASLAGTKIEHGLGFIRNRSFPLACGVAGALLILGGVGLDAILLVNSLQGWPRFDNDLSIAALAQSLLLAGGSLLSFGLIVSWLHWDERHNRNGD